MTKTAFIKIIDRKIKDHENSLNYLREDYHKADTERKQNNISKQITQVSNSQLEWYHLRNEAEKIDELL